MIQSIKVAALQSDWSRGSRVKVFLMFPYFADTQENSCQSWYRFLIWIRTGYFSNALAPSFIFRVIQRYPGPVSPTLPLNYLLSWSRAFVRHLISGTHTQGLLKAVISVQCWHHWIAWLMRQVLTNSGGKQTTVESRNVGQERGILIQWWITFLFPSTDRQRFIENRHTGTCVSPISIYNFRIKYFSFIITSI
jgi:hypothetical protein